MKKYLLFASAALLLGAGCGRPPVEVSSFEECASAGYPIMESYPRQCRANGRSYTEIVAPAPRPDGRPFTNAELGEAFTLFVGQSRGIDGGMRVTLLAINDSRCKPDVQCIWAGELSAMLRVEGPEDTAPVREMTLGTVRGRAAEASGYRFELKDASESFVTLAVTR